MIFYITNFDFLTRNGEGMGWWKKVFSQSKVFKKYFGDVFVTARSNQVAYLIKGNHIERRKIALTRTEYVETIKEWMREYHVRKTYVRAVWPNMWLVRLLKYLSEQGVRFVLEFPTYPYEGEIAKSERMRTEDRIYRRYIPDFVDRISTYSRDDSIWGIPCICLVNGIDMDDIPVHARSHRDDNRITLIAVAGFQFWHGYERLIEGVREYYLHQPSREVHVDFVGNGPEKSRYEELVYKYSLQRYVKFYGMKSGEDLNKIYDVADVAIESLGSYKKGLKCGCSLKGAEYCARGFPIVLGEIDLRFHSQLPFVIQFPNDNSPLGIESIIRFYDRVKKIDNYPSKIREYAELNLSWEKIMNPVIEYLMG